MKLEKLALIVDNDLGFQEYWLLALNRRGFQSRVCDTEDQALRLVRAQAPHVAIVHFKENQQRSIEFISYLSKEDVAISIIYVTAYAGESLLLRATRAGAFVVLHKSEIHQLTNQIDLAFNESLKRRNTSVNREVFVLMPFAEAFEEIYRLGIKEPLEALGFTCNRADEALFVGNVIDELYRRISNARLIVADITGKNPNVTYELGFAHAIGKQVILVTQKAEDIPFDISVQRHIVYGAKIVKLREELTRMVSELEKEDHKDA